MNWELEQERMLFETALRNAIAWQNRCVELYEILELVCFESEAAQAVIEANKGIKQTKTKGKHL